MGRRCYIPYIQRGFMWREMLSSLHSKGDSWGGNGIFTTFKGGIVHIYMSMIAD